MDSVDLEHSLVIMEYGRLNRLLHVPMRNLMNSEHQYATDGIRTIVGGLDGVHIYTVNQDGTLGEKVLLNKTIEIDELSDFGNSVGIDGNYAIVGAPYDDNELNIITGSAYIYERDDTTGDWSDPIALTLPNDLVANSQFGSSVAINGQLRNSGRTI